ncbi:MAG TPA: bifunctional glutamate N-acetyltransferase/amino-acid acetyltransferase ArgJ [bacterium]|nr:bifunctional glutamate N-acetyltransferase/amino-acid acetyltransferase ArgJ [bacterium]HPP29312.1 bifunctional glutamate N-acetyltransferase/amino-acid acetyltransferase ArgJ [bacterium]
MERGGITYPEGFSASAVHCGIKKEKKEDLTLIFSKHPCVAAGTFTTNQFKSYSLLWTLKNIKNPVQAVLINSGNANTCNGMENYRYTELLAKELSKITGIDVSSILIGSTGIIGKPLPYEKILSALPNLVNTLSPENHTLAARGIMTTDRVPKEFQIATGIKGLHKEVFIGGMVKGAGMINPCMATMLCFITTDAVIERDLLQSALKESVEESFNMVNVDNDMSTNDMVICLANGMAKNRRIRKGSEEYEKFLLSLKTTCIELAKMIASDGEGATKLIEVVVKGGWSLKDARRVAKRVAGSNLFKSAVYGAYPNWGRILAAAGSVNAKIDVKNTEVSLCGIKVYNGAPVEYDEVKLHKIMEESDRITVEMDIKKGSFSATAWGCDLTEDYVRINKE